MEQAVLFSPNTPVLVKLTVSCRGIPSHTVLKDDMACCLTFTISCGADTDTMPSRLLTPFTALIAPLSKCQPSGTCFGLLSSLLAFQMPLLTLQYPLINLQNLWISALILLDQFLPIKHLFKTIYSPCNRFIIPLSLAPKPHLLLQPFDWPPSALKTLADHRGGNHVWKQESENLWIFGLYSLFWHDMSTDFTIKQFLVQFLSSFF